MSIEAEIEATVSAFVADLMALVRATALESVRAALAGEARGRPSVRSGEPRRGPASTRASRSQETRGQLGGHPPIPAPARPRGAGPPTVRSFQLDTLGGLGGTSRKEHDPSAVPRAPGVVVRRIP